VYGALAKFMVISDTGRWRVTLVHAAWVCVVASIALSLLGVYAIDLGQRPVAEGPLAPSARIQAIFAGVGFIVALAIALPHYRVIGLVSWPAMIVSIGLLIFVLIPIVPQSIVRPINGARSWIDLGPLNLQPSELAKIAFVLVLAGFLRFRRQHRTLLGLVPPAIIAFVPMALINLQPDLGSALLFVPALFAMLVAAGARLRHLTLVVLVAGMAAPAAYPMLRPHQRARIEALWQQMQGSAEGAEGINYQSIKAQMLAGSGGLAGQSDGHARQLIEFNPLPEAHNDMIFSVIATRFGFFGGALVLGLYALWMAGALLVAASCKDPMGRLIVVGLTAFIIAQVVVNVGMNIGLLPIIGITLPFVSAGGSSMIAVWIMTGLVVNVAMRKPVPPYRPAFEWEGDW
jgi:rod shape determining protein RodA